MTDYARAACDLQYKMDFMKIKEVNITMSLPPLPFSRTYPLGSYSYQLLVMFNPLSSFSVYRFGCLKINFHISCVLLIYQLVYLSCSHLCTLNKMAY